MPEKCVSHASYSLMEKLEFVCAREFFTLQIYVCAAETIQILLFSSCSSAGKRDGCVSCVDGCERVLLDLCFVFQINWTDLLG